jgi:hypothetical protein
VADMDEWILMSSHSLQKISGKSLFDISGVDHPSKVRTHERYAVLSHIVQDDPIYCYFNKVAFMQFKWTEGEVYQLPSRYSAPSGAARDSQQDDIKKAIDEDYRELSSVIRQTKGRW